VGFSQSLTPVINVGGITQIGEPTEFQSGARARFTYNEDRLLIGVTAQSSSNDGTSPSAEVTFTGTGEDGEITQPPMDALDYNVGFYTAVKADGSASGVVASAVAHGWNYQSFGAWTIAANGPAPQHVVVQTGGTVTEMDNVPTTGSATYTGRSAGVLHIGIGQIFDTRSDVAVVADFGGGMITFDTDETMIDDRATDLGSRRARNLDLQGRFSYTGISQFGGDVSNVTDGNLLGRVDGQFYGPAAVEVGGTFTVGDGISTSYIGAFGAAQQPAAE
jgi:hypothetical protein